MSRFRPLQNMKNTENYCPRMGTVSRTRDAGRNWLWRIVRRLRRRPVLLLQNIGSGCGYQLFWEHHDGTRERIKTGLAAPGDCIPVPAKTECRWIEAGGNREGMSTPRVFLQPNSKQ